MHKAAAHAKRGLPLRHLPAMDLPFLVLVLTLVGFGLVMLGSASSAVALYRRGDAFACLRPQLLYAALGIGAMWVASRVDYHIYHKLAWPLLALSMVLLTPVPPTNMSTAPMPKMSTGAGEVRFQQHEHGHRSQHQCKGQHPHRKAAHAVVVERNDMRKHQHHRKFGDLAGLQCAQARQHQPALAAVVLRHEQHRRQQYY